jgi:PBP1b-binding outer membrane lipoprotein LpoB
MAGVYGDLQNIMRKRLGLVALLAMALAGCGQAVRTQVSVTYTDGPCAVTVQSWR